MNNTGIKMHLTINGKIACGSDIHPEEGSTNNRKEVNCEKCEKILAHGIVVKLQPSSIYGRVNKSAPKTSFYESWTRVSDILKTRIGE